MMNNSTIVHCSINNLGHALFVYYDAHRYVLAEPEDPGMVHEAKQEGQQEEK
jgi:hypothetical protein